MADVVFVATIIAFFLLSALYVTWCDRIIGPDDFSSEPTDGDDVDLAGTTVDEHADADTSAAVDAGTVTV